MRREIHCTNIPKTKAMATERKMAKITVKAFSVFRLNLMVAGDITTGGALDTQVGSDIAQGNSTLTHKHHAMRVILHRLMAM